MEYNIEFQISSLVIVGMLMAVFFKKKRLQTLENKIYGYILCGLFIAGLTDIASVVTLATPDRHPVLTIFFAKLYLIEMMAMAALLSNYTIALSFHGVTEAFPKYRRYIMFGWYGFAGACMILCLFLDIYAGGYGRHVYTTGGAVTLTYTVGGLALVSMLVFTYIMRNEIPKKKQMPIFGYAVIVALTTIIQRSYPYYLLTTFSMSVSVFFMYFTLENPDLKLILALNEAKDEAENANKAKTAFLASMSHEIRTPINAVIGMNEMIIREARSPQIEEYAMHIQNASETLLTIVNNVLDFAKIDSGKMEVKDNSYSLVNLLLDVTSRVEISAQKKKLSLQCEVQRDLPSNLFGDEIHIKQILGNLLTNAVKYTQQGHIILSISGRKVSDHNVLLMIKVSDTGIGIKQEDITKLTQSFLRMEEDANQTMEGTGLGLAIISGLLKLMDSKLTIVSEYGKGSEFSFEIMQRVEEWSPIGDFQTYLEQNADAQSGERDSIYAPNANVLIVDDNELNLSVMKGLLKRTGAKLVTAMSGAETIELVAGQRFDIIFIDYMMPQMDGIETYSKIKEMWKQGEQMATLAGTPFVVVTANAVIGAKEMYLEQGFTDFLSKPVYAEQLEFMLRKYLPRQLWTQKKAEAPQSTEIKAEDSLTEDGSEDGGIGSCFLDEEFLEKQKAYFGMQWQSRRQCLSQAMSEGDLTQVQIIIREMSRQIKLLPRNGNYAPLSHLLQKLDLLLADGQSQQVRSQLDKLIQMTEEYIK